MAVPSGIFMSPQATPALNLITEDPFTKGYQSQDDFLRRQAESEARLRAADQALGINDQRMQVSAYDLSERQRKAEEALRLDEALRTAIGGAMGRPNMAVDPIEDVTVPNQSSAGTRDRDTNGPVDPGYAGQTGVSVGAPTVAPPAVPGDASYLAAQRKRESGGVLTAKNPNSTATGPDQFIESTWLSVLPTVELRLGQDFSGMTREQKLALRTDPDISAAASFVLRDQNKKQMSRSLGREVGDPEAHLAHFLGASGATRMLQAPLDDEARLHATPEAVAANAREFRPGRTVRDLLASRGVGGGNAAMAAAPAPATAPAQQPAGTGQPADDQTMPTWGRPNGDPRLQAAQRALATTPGGGSALLKMVQGEVDGAQAAKLKVFELAGRGQADTAAALAAELGIKINPNMLRNQAVSRSIWELLRTVGVQDPDYAMRVIKNLGPDGDIQTAISKTDGGPERRPLAGGAGGVGRVTYRSVPGRGLYRIDPNGGPPELVVEVGDMTSPYKMQARARDLAVREANSQITPPGSGWIDRRTAEIMAEFERVGQTGAAGPGAAAGAPPDAGGIPPNAVPIAPSLAPPAAPPDAGGIPPNAVPIAPSLAPPAAPAAPGTMVPGGAAPGASPGFDIGAQAQAAIRAGADPEQVRQRAMQQYGFDPLPPGGGSEPAFMGLTP